MKKIIITSTIDIKQIVGTIIRGEQALKFPLEYHDYGQECRDANGNLVFQLRGWGRLQYLDHGDKSAELQDSIGKWIVETVNAEANRLGLDTK